MNNLFKMNNQAVFFDLIENQYPINLISNPPLHTQLEVGIIVNKLQNINKNKPIVDFGAGSGRFTISLLNKGFSVYAVDISNKSLANLKKNSRKLDHSKLITSDSIALNLNFPAIIGADILHHIDLDRYLPIFYRSLKKGGKIIFSEPGAFNLSWYIYLPLASKWSIEKGVINCNYFNLKRMLKKYGYRNIKITGFGLLPRPFFNFSKRLCILNDFLGNFPILNLFAYRYIIEATK